MLSTRGPTIAALAVAGLLASCSSGSSEGSQTTTTPSRTTTTVVVMYSAQVVGEVEVNAVYRQGLARFDTGWIFSFNDGLFHTDDARATRRSSRVPAIPPEWKARGFDHIGDIDVAKGVLDAPLEQPDYERGQ